MSHGGKMSALGAALYTQREWRLEQAERYIGMLTTTFQVWPSRLGRTVWKGVKRIRHGDPTPNAEKANILCRHHNSMLSELDQLAGKIAAFQAQANEEGLTQVPNGVGLYSVDGVDRNLRRQGGVSFTPILLSGFEGPQLLGEYITAVGPTSGPGQAN